MTSFKTSFWYEVSRSAVMFLPYHKKDCPIRDNLFLTLFYLQSSSSTCPTTSLAGNVEVFCELEQ